MCVCIVYIFCGAKICPKKDWLQPHTVFKLFIRFANVFFPRRKKYGGWKSQMFGWSILEAQHLITNITVRLCQQDTTVPRRLFLVSAVNSYQLIYTYGLSLLLLYCFSLSSSNKVTNLLWFFFASWQLTLM